MRYSSVIASLLAILTASSFVRAEAVSLAIDSANTNVDVTVSIYSQAGLLAQFTRKAEFSGDLEFNVGRDGNGAVSTLQLTPQTEMYATGLQDVTIDFGTSGTEHWSFEQIAFTFANKVFPPYAPSNPRAAPLISTDPSTQTSTYQSDLSLSLMPVYQGYLTIGPGTGAVDQLFRQYDPDGIIEFYENDGLKSFPSEFRINANGGIFSVSDGPNGINEAWIDLNTTDFDLIPILSSLGLTFQLSIVGQIRTVPVPETSTLVLSGLVLMVTSGVHATRRLRSADS